MRVLFYFAWSVDELGGAEIATQSLAEGLAGHGHDVGMVETLHTKLARPLRTRTFEGPVWSIQVPAAEQGKRAPAAAFGQFWSIVSKFKPDILCVPCPSWWQAAPLVGASALPHRWRLVVALHGSEMLYDAENPRLRPWLNRIFSTAAAVTVVSESLREDFNARYPMMAHKTRVIYNGLEARWYAPSGPVEGGPKARYVLYVGRFDRIKGLDILLRAWKRLNPSARQLELWLAGGGAEEDAVRALARNLEMAEHVRFVGVVAQQDLPALFSNAELVVMPSRHEGLPRVALEAGACAAVCVGTRVGGIPEVIDDTVTGFLVPPESPVALANALLQGLELTPEERRRMGAAARKRISREFNHARTLAAYEQLFRSLLEPAA